MVNAGEAEAGPFQIAFTADGAVVPFEVEGIDPSGGLAGEALGPEGRLPIAATVLLPSTYELDRVLLVVEADTCAGDPNAPPACAIAETREDNNSLRLEAVDIQVLDVVLGQPETQPVIGKQLPPVRVPVTFSVANAGPKSADEFWLAAYVAQRFPPLTLERLETDPETNAVRLEGLEAGKSVQVRGEVTVAPYELGSLLAIVAGCAPRVDPCLRPEIALENNVQTAQIPVPLEPTPTPTPPASPSATPYTPP